MSRKTHPGGNSLSEAEMPGQVCLGGRHIQPGNPGLDEQLSEDSYLTRSVEVAGIEPASFSTSPGLLRAQPASLFSAPGVLQAGPRRAQSLLDVPLSPATGPGGGSSSLMPDTGPEELPG